MSFYKSSLNGFDRSKLSYYCAIPIDINIIGEPITNQIVVQKPILKKLAAKKPMQANLKTSI